MVSDGFMMFSGGFWRFLIISSCFWLFLMVSDGFWLVSIGFWWFLMIFQRFSYSWWFPDGLPMFFLWSPLVFFRFSFQVPISVGFLIVLFFLSSDSPMVFRWFSHCIPTVFLLLCCGFPMLSWDFPMVSLRLPSVWPSLVSVFCIFHTKFINLHIMSLLNVYEHSKKTHPNSNRFDHCLGSATMCNVYMEMLNAILPWAMAPLRHTPFQGSAHKCRSN